MKPPKAIEILRLEYDSTLPPRNEDLFAAIKLGKEALERLEAYRRDKWHMANIPLPSEEK